MERSFRRANGHQGKWNFLIPRKNLTQSPALELYIDYRATCIGIAYFQRGHD
jgi:hypothetical protein